MTTKTIAMPKCQELAFDETSHIYKLNGIQIPSVTTVMRPLSESYYGSIDTTVLATVAKRGKDVHHAIENNLKYGVDDIPEELEGYYSAYKKWWEEKQPKFVESEGRVYHKIFRYAGTSDLSCKIDGAFICVDFKTSSQIVEMLTRVQLEAYSRAYESHSVKFEGKAIVQLQRDGNYKMVSHDVGDFEAWEVFCGLLAVNNYLKKHGR